MTNSKSWLLTELSTKTLKKYVKKATVDRDENEIAAMTADKALSRHLNDPEAVDAYNYHSRKTGNRETGIERAKKKLGEETNLHELSPSLLGRYIHRSNKDERARREQGLEIQKKMNAAFPDKRFGTPFDRKLYHSKASRQAGRNLALHKLTNSSGAKVHAKEEALDELSRDTLQRYKGAADRDFKLRGMLARRAHRAMERSERGSDPLGADFHDAEREHQIDTQLKRLHGRQLLQKRLKESEDHQASLVAHLRKSGRHTLANKLETLPPHHFRQYMHAFVKQHGLTPDNVQQKYEDAKKRLNKEDLQELSKGTLNRYIHKAAADVDRINSGNEREGPDGKLRDNQHSGPLRSAYDRGDKDSVANLERKLKNRRKGMIRALRKHNRIKEDLNELSVKTHTNYTWHRGQYNVALNHLIHKAKKRLGTDHPSEDEITKQHEINARNRQNGRKRSMRLLRTKNFQEETDLQELSRVKLRDYLVKATSDTKKPRKGITKAFDRWIQTAEHLNPSMGADSYIDDFVHSNNPEFKGKSKKERIKMALGAYYGAKNENLQELSKFKLGSYIMRASSDREEAGYQRAVAYKNHDIGAHADEYKRAQKRAKGIRRATQKLALQKESDLTELSRHTLMSYVRKAGEDIQTHKWGMANGQSEKADSARKISKRVYGMTKAAQKLGGNKLTIGPTGQNNKD